MRSVKEPNKNEVKFSIDVPSNKVFYLLVDVIVPINEPIMILAQSIHKKCFKKSKIKMKKI